MKHPHVTLFGTAPQELYDQTHAALGAVRAALEALANTAPHARDYPRHLSIVTRQHADRMARLTSVKTELEEILDRLNGEL